MEAPLTEWWPVKAAGKGMCSTGIQGERNCRPSHPKTLRVQTPGLLERPQVGDKY